MADTPITVPSYPLRLITFTGLELRGHAPVSEVSADIDVPAHSGLVLTGYWAVLEGHVVETPPVDLRLVTFTGLELRGQAPTVTVPNLSADRLNISGWDSGWPSGFITNVDERVDNFDGSTISTTIVGDTVLLDFDNVTALRDIDTVNKVEVVLRAQEVTGDGAATATLDVELLINSVKQGSTQSTGTLGVAFTTSILLDAGWDSDWTLAEVNSLQLRITSANAAAGAPEWAIDCIDINVIYVPLLAGSEYTEDGALVLAGQAPIVSRSAEFYTGVPAAATPALLGYVPVLDHSIPVAAGALSLAGKVAYRAEDLLTTQLQVTSWDSGWPTGFAANVDDPTSAPDGQTVSTTINLDAAVFSFGDVTGIIDNADDVLGVSMVLRAQCDSGGTGAIQLNLLLNGVDYGGNSRALSSTMTNYALPSTAEWIGDFSVAQLNALQVRATVSNLSAGDAVYIDGIDVIVTYAKQTPIQIFVGARYLLTTGYAPNKQELKNIFTGARYILTTGYAPTLKRDDLVYPGEETLLLLGQAPLKTIDFIPLPSVGALVLAGQAGAVSGQELLAPAIDALSLAGKVPVADPSDNHVALPARRKLLLAEQMPAPQTVTAATIPPPNGALLLASKTPVAIRALNIWSYPGSTALALAGVAPSITQSQVRAAAAATLTLTATLPADSTNEPVAPGVVALNFGYYAPQLWINRTELSLVGYAPSITVNHVVVPTATALVLTPLDVDTSRARTVKPAAAALQLTGYEWTPGFSTGLTPGQPGIISVSRFFDIEFIATPTDILID